MWDLIELKEGRDLLLISRLEFLFFSCSWMAKLQEILIFEPYNSYQRIQRLLTIRFELRDTSLAS